MASGSLEQLSQVATSTVANAIEFSPKGATVTVVLAQVGDTVRLTVRDHGQGIPHDQLDHLFQPFSRSDGLEAITLNHEGLGLNLYIDKLIMESVGGQITAQSVLGRGTTMTLSWPATRQSTQSLPIGRTSRAYNQDI